MSTRVLLVLAILAGTASAEEKRPKLNFGVFVDGYYAFDANEPTNRERLFTTLPTRHNEFAINLAYLEAKLDSDRVRSRVALQTGTSVFANYASELRDPTKTGPQLADHLMNLQEAYAGYRLADGLWLDAGVYFSHIGLEGFISRDNWAYTRSLVADFSPYYQSGVRVSYEANPHWSFQLHVINGWQNLIETNAAKSLGTQVVYHPTEDFSVTHNTLVGKEAELRVFQDLIVKYRFTSYWESGIALDYGMQKRPASNRFADWYGASFQNRLKLEETTHLGLRLETYSDPDGVIVPTGTPQNFQTIGASVNLDRQLAPELVWRSELRVLHSRDAVFPSGTGPRQDTVFGVTSLAFSL